MTWNTQMDEEYCFIFFSWNCIRFRRKHALNIHSTCVCVCVCNFCVQADIPLNRVEQKHLQFDEKIKNNREIYPHKILSICLNIAHSQMKPHTHISRVNRINSTAIFEITRQRSTNMNGKQTKTHTEIWNEMKTQNACQKPSCFHFSLFVCSYFVVYCCCCCCLCSLAIYRAAQIVYEYDFDCDDP